MQSASGSASHTSTLPAIVQQNSLRGQINLACPCLCLAAGIATQSICLCASNVRKVSAHFSNKGLSSRCLSSQVKVSQPGAQPSKPSGYNTSSLEESNDPSCQGLISSLQIPSASPGHTMAGAENFSRGLSQTIQMPLAAWHSHCNCIVCARASRSASCDQGKHSSPSCRRSYSIMWSLMQTLPGYWLAVHRLQGKRAAAIYYTLPQASGGHHLKSPFLIVATC